MIVACLRSASFIVFFFFNDTATTEIYTLSLHDALPIYPPEALGLVGGLLRLGHGKLAQPVRIMAKFELHWVTIGWSQGQSIDIGRVLAFGCPLEGDYVQRNIGIARLTVNDLVIKLNSIGLQL